MRVIPISIVSTKFVSHVFTEYTGGFRFSGCLRAYNNIEYYIFVYFPHNQKHAIHFNGIIRLFIIFFFRIPQKHHAVYLYMLPAPVIYR